MEKKKKDNKLTPTTQEAETNDFLSREDQNQNGSGLAIKNSRTGSPPPDNPSPLIQQYPPILQWPYTLQSTMGQSPLISRPSLPTQQPPHIVLNQWQASLLNPQQQLPQQQQLNPINHQLQHGKPLSQLTQSTGPFWLPPRPGFHVAGAAAPSSYHPLTPGDANWQASAISGGGTSSRNEPQIPSFCYQGGHSHPMGFPGPWDPSSWCGQAQPDFTCTFPGAYGYFCLPLPPVPDCSVVSGRSLQRGIIRPPAKLSQRHLQVWEAQSRENVQLWTMIGHLQSEVAAYGSRLMKLEAEVSSQKPTVEESAGTGVGTTLAGQTSKRGRPKRPVASIDVLPSPDESQPRAHARRPATCKVQFDTKGLIFEKESLSKVEDKEKASHPTLGTGSSTNVQQENNEKISNLFANSSSNFELYGGNLKLPLDVHAPSMFHNQVHRDNPRIQISAVGLNPTSEMTGNGSDTEDQKTAFSILCQTGKGPNNKVASATYRGTTKNGSHRWPSRILSDDCGRDSLDVSSHGFYDNGSVIRQGGKVVPGWSFVNEENNSEENEDLEVRSGKDDEEEMEEDASSSGAEEIARAKVEGAYDMDQFRRTSPKGLPQSNRW
ncbi:hypothetical protein HHK36_009682 [Tetracentron sinense]|uniref:Uncharacterized protein n=1 Tax=Tetracentron sinense TaxID=13715 RepID=A0A835DHQ5_TETSI|nr:hypothetical protein HHK36_009682 [Tetracentron sinense]